MLWTVIGLILIVCAGLFLKRFLTCWNRNVISVDGATAPLQVDLTTLENDLKATSSDLPWGPTYTLAKICNASYEDWPEDETKTKPDFLDWGFKIVSPVKKKKQYAYVLSNDKIVVVVFRGTDDWEDLKKDVWAFSEPWNQGHIHAGFLSALNDLIVALDSKIQEHGAKNKHLWITGHSLGGAMAIAFAHDCIANHKLRPSGVVTFGQPRCFDRKLGENVAKELHEKYVRFVNEHDLVPWLPPPLMPHPFSGYVHVGARYLFLYDKIDFLDSTTICMAPPENQKAASSDGEKRMSSEEYEKLEERIQKATESIPRATMAKGASNKISLRTLAEHIPEFRDHCMENYISSMESYSNKISKDSKQAGNGVGNL